MRGLVGVIKIASIRLLNFFLKHTDDLITLKNIYYCLHGVFGSAAHSKFLYIFHSYLHCMKRDFKLLNQGLFCHDQVIWGKFLAFLNF